MNEPIQMFCAKGNYILEIKNHKQITGKHVILWNTRIFKNPGIGIKFTLL